MSKLSRREFGKLASAAGAGAITASGLPPFSHRWRPRQRSSSSAAARVGRQLPATAEKG